MLQLRPSCEHCNKALSPAASDALICTFECTFCAQCVHDILKDVCPNCSGDFTPRPIRPAALLKKYPASTVFVHKPVNLEAHYKKHNLK